MDTEISKTDRGVLVTVSIFEIMLGLNETKCPEKSRVIGGHSFGTVVKVSASPVYVYVSGSSVRIVERYFAAKSPDRRKECWRKNAEREKQ
jgi:hypothetical protein